MTPNPVHRLPAPLEAAIQRVKFAARDATERTIESLGLAALAAGNAYQRDGLLGAQFELNRKSAVFALSFNEAYDQRVLREIAPRQADSDGHAGLPAAATAAATPGAKANTNAPPAPTDWGSLSLVEDKEVEAQISAERFGMGISHACEWELRELEGYISAILGNAGGERDRNPLRPDLVGHAMIRAIDDVSDREDVRKVLSAELSRSLGDLLRGAYGDIIAALRKAGVQPSSLAVRNRVARRGAGDVEGSGGGAYVSSDHGGLGPQETGGHSRPGAYGGLPAGYSPESRRGAGPNTMAAPRGNATLGPLDPDLMALIRSLNRGGVAQDTGAHEAADFQVYEAAPDPSMPLPLPRNLIRAHREELRQASNGALDHMVIDVIGFMFDQILADPKVPPQLARQIARLQLPVLRAALGDKTFFSSRRHPVRRFINRIASLGSAFEDFNDEAAKGFLGKVRALVQEVAEGDFDRIETYEQKLAELEAYTQQAAQQGPDAVNVEVAALLAEKEDQQRLRELYAERMAGELQGVDAPPFLRDFIASVWSRVLLHAAERGGAKGALATRLRGVARELFLSVQPKATPAHRKAFLAELPKLMQDLTEGMNLIGWPEAERRTFFGQLMPAHAEALKTVAGRTLDINLMARQVEGVLLRPPPSPAEVAAAPPPSAASAPPQLTEEEARRVGLVTESAVNWDGKVDIDVGAEAATAPDGAGLLESSPPGMPGSPVPPGSPGAALRADATEAAEPTEGRALAEHLQVGYPYQMHINEAWQKVRLSHISPGRSFFIFSHGSKQRQTVSLTQRMLLRLCETGRLKAYETSYLVERATARARRQLAAMSSPAR